MKHPFAKRTSMVIVLVLLLSACGPEALAQAAEAGLPQNAGLEVQGEDPSLIVDSDDSPSEAAAEDSDTDDDSGDDEFGGADDSATADDLSPDDDAADDQPGEDAHASGTIEALNDTSVTIDGVAYAIDGDTSLDDGLGVGVTARIEFFVQADGTLLAKEIETDASDDNGDDAEDNDADDDSEDEDTGDDEEDDDQDNSGPGSDDDQEDDNSGSDSEHEDDDHKGSGSGGDDQDDHEDEDDDD
jgi:hypothetical protein